MLKVMRFYNPPSRNFLTVAPGDGRKFNRLKSNSSAPLSPRVTIGLEDETITSVDRRVNKKRSITETRNAHLHRMVF